MSDADSAFQIFAREAIRDRWHSLSEIESSLDIVVLGFGDCNGQIRLKSTAAIADSKLELRPAATVTSKITEF
ncbi:MAG: hypothetical protein WCF82_04140 [Microcoleus sp.]